ncbi:MAG: acetyl-CoA carboxylase biotin carboxyl carrier protein subunit [Deltaproteobacteria bacterium]|nr:acetyl-CoA carboxylase biotin carboxyl carrier protein subunit [Deltaproteobacteria bacterium]
MRDALFLNHGKTIFRLVVSGGEGHFFVKDEDGEGVDLEIFRLADGCCEVTNAGQRQLVHFAVDGDRVFLQRGGEVFAFSKERHEVVRHQGAVNDDLRAPMPGQITSIFVEAGQRVEVGQPLYGLEAMKMESLVRAPIAAVVTSIHASPGEQVDGGALIIELEAVDEDDPGASEDE